MATVLLELEISHGTSLTLRNVQVYVAINGAKEPPLGRPLLESLGLNRKDQLAPPAAADKFGIIVDVSDLDPTWIVP